MNAKLFEKIPKVRRQPKTIQRGQESRVVKFFFNKFLKRVEKFLNSAKEKIALDSIQFVQVLTTHLSPMNKTLNKNKACYKHVYLFLLALTPGFLFIQFFSSLCS